MNDTHATQYDSLLWACIKSLKRLQSESHATLNLLSLVARFPTGAECREALEAQRRREERALAQYRQRIRNLLDAIEANNRADGAAAAGASCR